MRMTCFDENALGLISRVYQCDKERRWMRAPVDPPSSFPSTSARARAHPATLLVLLARLFSAMKFFAVTVTFTRDPLPAIPAVESKRLDSISGSNDPRENISSLGLGDELEMIIVIIVD